MLRTIRLTHFKCFEQLDLDCARITLLCGPETGWGRAA